MREQIGAAVGVLLLPLLAAASEPLDVASVRTEFEAAMDEITADLSGLIVTSKLRSEEDQVRLASLGYRPHSRSQHKLGLAWDVVGPEESLETLAERARVRGFVPVPSRSAVTGVAYLHVQRFSRSPVTETMVAALAAAELAPAIVPASFPPPAGAVGTPEPAPAPPRIERPRLLAGQTLELPRKLRRARASGEIVLELSVGESGEVTHVEVAASDLPAFEEFVLETVRGWRFSPPTRDGVPFAGRARLPIPIHVR